MGLFSRKKEEKKKEVVKTAKVAIGEEKKESMKELYNENKVSQAKEGKKVKEGKDGETASVRSDSGPRRGKEKKYGNAYQNIVKPLVTEKASALGVEDKYIFQVAPKANKIEIAKSIEEIYGIKPVSVNIINLRGKNVRYGRTIGRRKSWKKAIIKLPKGKTIKIYEGV